MFLYKLYQYTASKIKIIKLKILFGRRIKIHWSARIAPSVKVRINGEGKICIGEHVIIRENGILNVSSGGEIFIGDRVFMNDNCFFNARKLVHIEPDTMFGQGVKIYDHDHDFRSNDIKTCFKQDPVYIDKKCWICSSVIILRGVTIGAGSVVASGTIVRKNVSSNVMYYTQRITQEKEIVFYIS